MRMKRLSWIYVFAFVFLPALVFGATLFQENFDNTSFSSRGWYDITGGTISNSEHISGSTGSFECRFAAGGTGCSGGMPKRHKFTESNSVYLSYWVKHSSNWQGSGKSKTYHPHVIYLLTNKNGDWDGLSFDHLTVYIEENLGYPQLAIQDGQNINESKIGVDLTTTTEQRAVAGCNGTPPDISPTRIDCYPAGSGHYNSTTWRGPTAYFFDPNQMAKWHFVETYIQLNTVSNGKGQPDGILRYWYDGQLVIDRSNIIFRTAQYPDMQFNQLIIAPWIGDGSPVDQTFWIDNMTVATSRPSSSTSPPSPPSRLTAQ